MLSGTSKKVSCQEKEHKELEVSATVSIQAEGLKRIRGIKATETRPTDRTWVRVGLSYRSPQSFLFSFLTWNISIGTRMVIT
jgi:hypothetical protein